MSLRNELLFLRNAAHAMGDLAEREKCFSLLRRGAPYEQLFFGEVSDPRWLSILTERGFFSLVCPYRTPQKTVVSATLHICLCRAYPNSL